MNRIEHLRHILRETMVLGEMLGDHLFVERVPDGAKRCVAAFGVRAAQNLRDPARDPAGDVELARIQDPPRGLRARNAPPSDASLDASW